MAVTVAIEAAQQDEVRALIAELNAFLDSFLGPDAPAEFHAHMTIDEMAGPDTLVFVARSRGAAVGCCALRDRGDGTGEVKRMFVRAGARGKGIARSMLASLRDQARARGMTSLLLETGASHVPARRLYEAFGFRPRDAFAPYWEDPHSVFLELPLA